MRRKRASGTCGKKLRSSCAPECTKRKPTWENWALPPDSCLGAFSIMTTWLAPDCLAEMAASSAAEPPPTTMTSQVFLELMFSCSVATGDEGFCSAVGEVFVRELRFRIGQRALGHAEAHAHLGEADADRLGIEHLRAGRFRQIVGIDHVGDERSAERDDDLGAGLGDQAADQL